MSRLLVLLALLGCDDIRTLGSGAGWDLTWLPFIDGNVYQCRMTGTPIEVCPDQVDGVCIREWCTDLDARDLTLLALEMGYGSLGGSIYCRPTPRHLGPCTLECDGDAAIGGCNALHGCICP